MNLLTDETAVDIRSILKVESGHYRGPFCPFAITNELFRNDLIYQKVQVFFVKILHYVKGFALFM